MEKQDEFDDQLRKRMKDEKDKMKNIIKEKLKDVWFADDKDKEKLVDDVINPAFATPAGLILFGAQQEPRETLASFTRRIKIPSKGMAGKVVDTIKNLLP